MCSLIKCWIEAISVFFFYFFEINICAFLLRIPDLFISRACMSMRHMVMELPLWLYPQLYSIGWIDNNTISKRTWSGCLNLQKTTKFTSYYWILIVFFFFLAGSRVARAEWLTRMVCLLTLLLPSFLIVFRTLPLICLIIGHF